MAGLCPRRRIHRVTPHERRSELLRCMSQLLARSGPTEMSAICPLSGGGLKRSTQHFILEGRDGVDAMERGYVRGFDAVAKAELWERWRRGESLKAIGRAFGKPSSSIYFQVAPHGGIRPAPRRRSRLALTLAEREEISRGIAGARSMRSMARLLGHAPSTISREIKRNGGYNRNRA